MSDGGGPRGREVRANGLRFFLVDEGDGAPVLLLHGFPDTASLWRHQIPALVDAGYRVLAPDLRGRGRTEMPPRVEDYALRNVVRDVAALLDAAGVQRAHVVGHDWGAAAAWLVGSLLPERVDRLVAISVGHPATFGRPTLEQLQKGWYRILFQFEGTAEELLRQEDWYLFRELFRGGDPDAYVADLARPGALTAGLNWYRANLPVERLLAPRPALPPVTAPTLGVFGSEDLYLVEGPMLASAEHVRGPWRYERFDGAGHWIPLEQPDRLNRLLLEFLRA
jgi:pimeloyl-ACP methyl ester carboxylesterase